jgi:hypothetical protein
MIFSMFHKFSYYICSVVQEFLKSVSLIIYFNYSGILSYLAEWTRTHPMCFHKCIVYTGPINFDPLFNVKLNWYFLLQRFATISRSIVF